MERAYETYYSQRSGREAKEERDLLADWKLTDDQAWAILEKDDLKWPTQGAVMSLS